MNRAHGSDLQYHRTTNRLRRFTALFVAGGLLVPAAVCLAGVIGKVNVGSTGPVITASFQLNALLRAAAASGEGSVAGGCASVVMAWVIKDGVETDWSVDILGVSPGWYDTPVDPGLRDRLGDELDAVLPIDDYDPGYDDLFFMYYYPDYVDDSCYGYTFTVTFRLLDNGVPVLIDTLAGGAAYRSDFASEPLESFSSWSRPVVVRGDGVPTVSSWGVIALVLLLLVGARAYYRRGRTTASS